MVQKKGGLKADPKKATGLKGKPKAAPVAEKNPLFQPRKKNFGIGGDVQPARIRDLTRFVRWPLYIKNQRKERVIQRRLRVPPSVNQFRRTLDKINTNEIYKLAAKYKPESAQAQKKRLRSAAKDRMNAAHESAKAAKAAAKAAKKSGGKAPKQSKKSASKDTSKKYELVFGVQEVVRSIESQAARMVLIAHDVDPLEIVLALPALCQKLSVPYAIVKGKAALGRLTGFKTATCVAFENIRSEDQATFNNLVKGVNTTFAEKYEDTRKNWGGNQQGIRAKAKKAAVLKQKLKR
jgi:large subunit ribosomal protein L7Ae